MKNFIRLFCTQSGGRTRTPLRALDFESSASTDSAIWASALQI